MAIECNLSSLDLDILRVIVGIGPSAHIGEVMSRIGEIHPSATCGEFNGALDHLEAAGMVDRCHVDATLRGVILLRDIDSGRDDQANVRK